jgi:hypothetical protein
VLWQAWSSSVISFLPREPYLLSMQTQRERETDRSYQSLVVHVAPPTVTVMRTPGGGPLR